MFSRFFFVLVVFVAAPLVFVAMTGTGGEPAARRPVRGGQPVQLCLAADTPGVADVFIGRRRAVLAVYSYDPASDGGGLLEVSLVPTGESSQIGFFPDGPFRSKSRTDAQRFFLPSPTGAAAAELCYSVTLVGGKDAVAEISLEVSGELVR